ncbi:Protein of unknown function [Anaplasma phagocytophilum]|uniref:Uncharacterized protein n=1 Tax=Anaplasma phagocytophilum TaxID=948 RepID=A0A098GKJ3_ANAPH|nr:Protein of unknown function [Anaplasma phagocytophilum]
MFSLVNDVIQILVNNPATAANTPKVDHA